MFKCLKCKEEISDTNQANWTSQGYICKRCKKVLIESLPVNTDIQTQVHSPSHYKGNKLEVIDVIDDFNLNFRLGNCVKYILRAGKKDSRILDLNKALWYLKKEIENEN